MAGVASRLPSSITSTSTGDAAAGEGRAQARLDVGLLVPRRDQDGDQRVSVRRAARARQQQQIERAEQGRDGGEQRARRPPAPSRAASAAGRAAGRSAGRAAAPRRGAKPATRRPCPRRPCSKVSKRAGSRAMLSAAKRSRVAASAAAIRSEPRLPFLGQQNRGGDGLAEGRQHLRRALVPEGVFERERQEGRAGREFRQPAHARRDRHRPLPRVGEAARRVDPEQAVRRGQHLRRRRAGSPRRRARPAPRRTRRAGA